MPAVAIRLYNENNIAGKIFYASDVIYYVTIG